MVKKPNTYLRWKSRIHSSIYKRHSTTPVVNKEQCLYWQLIPGRGLALYWHSIQPQCRPTTDFGVMLVLNQYVFQYWHGTDVQYRTSTTPVPRQYRWTASSQVIFRSRAGGKPCLSQYRASTANMSAVLARYQVGCKFLPGIIFFIISHYQNINKAKYFLLKKISFTFYDSLRSHDSVDYYIISKCMFIQYGQWIMLTLLRIIKCMQAMRKY